MEFKYKVYKSPILNINDIKKDFLSNYIFSDKDENFKNIIFEPLYRIETIEGSWNVIKVNHLNKIDDLKTEKEEFPICIEGIAGMGKTTLLGKNKGGDLLELRKKYILLSGIGDNYSYIRSQLRKHENKNKKIVDRSDWLSSFIYKSYYRKNLYLFGNDSDIKIIKNLPGTIIIYDDPDISNEDIHDRIKNRKGVDLDVTPSYTIVTRLFFKYSADHYGFKILNTDEVKELINRYS